jgi:hypothetical protein
MSLPIYELKISEKLNDDAEVSYIALVDEPAIKKDFLAFKDEFINPSKGESKDDFIGRCMSYVVEEGKDQDQAYAICESLWTNHFDSQFAETYDDYPKEASENAKTALRWAEENGWGSCGTPVGKARANQLANGEPLSRETIARMAAFERHRQSSDRPLGEGCGRLMWLAWGGDAGVEWATRKLEQIDKQKMSHQAGKQSAYFKIENEDQRIISGPLMLADELIYRNNATFGEHYVKFSAETIKQIAIKFAKKKYQNRVNLMHDQNQIVEGVTMFETFIVDKKRGIQPMAGYKEVADGSWFGSFYVENDMVWEEVKAGKFRGFSVEGMFDYENPVTAEENALRKISELLNELID